MEKLKKICVIIFCAFFILAMASWWLLSDFPLFNTCFTFLVLFIGGIGCYYNRHKIIKICTNSTIKNIVKNVITLFLISSIMALANYYAFKYSPVFDLTKNKLHTLSDKSQQITALVNKPIQITLFAKRSEWSTYLAMIKQYERINQLIKVDAIDIDEHPEMAKLSGIKESGMIKIHYGQREVVVSSKSELDITNGILKALREKEIVIYYTTGHGEIDLEDESEKGGKHFKTLLENNSFFIRPLNLIEVSAIPQDADLVLVLGVNELLLDLEVNKLSEYSKKGGALFITFSPNLENKIEMGQKKLLQLVGLNDQNALVVDRLASTFNEPASHPVATDINGEHAIMDGVVLPKRLVFGMSRALIPLMGKSDGITPIVKSNIFPASWGEKSMEDLKKGRSDFSSDDIKGPINLLAMVKNREGSSEILVSACSEFLTNAWAKYSENMFFIVSLLSSYMGERDLVSLDRPDIKNERIFMSELQLNLIFIFSIFVIPFLFFVLAIYYYRRARSL